MVLLFDRISCSILYGINSEFSARTAAIEKGISCLQSKVEVSMRDRTSLSQEALCQLELEFSIKLTPLVSSYPLNYLAHAFTSEM